MVAVLLTSLSAYGGGPWAVAVEHGSHVGLATRTSLAVAADPSSLHVGHLPEGLVSWLVVPHCGAAVALAATADGRQPSLYLLDPGGVTPWGGAVASEQVGSLVLGSDGSTLWLVDERSDRVAARSCDGEMVGERDIVWGGLGCVDWRGERGWFGCGRARRRQPIFDAPRAATVTASAVSWTRPHERGTISARVHRAAGAPGPTLGEHTLLSGIIGEQIGLGERVAATIDREVCHTHWSSWDDHHVRAFGRQPSNGSWFSLFGAPYGLGRLDRYVGVLDACPDASWALDAGSSFEFLRSCLRTVTMSPEGSPMLLRIYWDGVAAYGWPLRTRHLIPYDREAPVITETTAAPRRLEEPVCEER